ncbi:MAG: hypothetical protein ACI9KS_001047 [Sulfitobacter sp.]|jgi:hypothetical protein
MSRPSIIARIAALFRNRLLVIGLVGVGVASALVFAGYSVATAQMSHHVTGMHGHGDDSATHDEMNMPGLRGLDATEFESEELAIMFRGFEQITREVENLPNGIRTITMSDDPELLGVVTSHVLGMIDRVDTGQDPQVFIQSPTLDILFERRASITTEIDFTDTGVIVIQTSEDPEVVAALQTHAGEVSDMVDRGMQAVHEAMMKRASN